MSKEENHKNNTRRHLSHLHPRYRRNKGPSNLPTSSYLPSSTPTPPPPGYSLDSTLIFRSDPGSGESRVQAGINNRKVPSQSLACAVTSLRPHSALGCSSFMPRYTGDSAQVPAPLPSPLPKPSHSPSPPPFPPPPPPLPLLHVSEPF